MKISTEQAVKAYESAGTLHGAGKLLGVNGNSVWYRLKKIGYKFRRRRWTQQETGALVALYEKQQQTGFIDNAAKLLGRSYSAIALRASRLGMGNPNRKKAPRGRQIGDEEFHRLFLKFSKTKLPLDRFAMQESIPQNRLRAAFIRLWPGDYSVVQEAKKPRSSHYVLGRNFEYRVRDYLLKRHWFVLRSPHSGGPADLVALAIGRTLLIQCKRGNWMSLSDKRKLATLAASVGGAAILAGMRGTRGAIYRLISADGSLGLPLDDEYFLL